MSTLAVLQAALAVLARPHTLAVSLPEEQGHALRAVLRRDPGLRLRAASAARLALVSRLRGGTLVRPEAALAVAGDSFRSALASLVPVRTGALRRALQSAPVRTT